MQTNQSLELRQQQHLALTPQLQQSIRLLQLSTLELEQELAQALVDNPLLERVDAEQQYGIEAGDGASASRIAESAMLGFANSSPDDDNDWFPEATESPTLADHLNAQLVMGRSEPRQRALLELLITELDDNGYLSCTLAEFVSYLPAELEISLSEVEAAHQRLLQLEPAGVGARSLAECLLIQLQRYAQEHTLSPELKTAARLAITQHLSLLSTASMQRLAEALGAPLELAQQAYALILSFEAKPGAPWAETVADYVVPDLLLKQVGSGWVVQVNPAVVPRLRLRQLEGWDARSHPQLAEQQQAAQALIRNINNRHITIARVGQTIVDHQRAYFQYGPAALRPLLLRDVAQVLELHESTVSRATRQKYMQTPQGTIELRTLFGEGLRNEDGSAIAPGAVQARISELIAQEPATKPLSDNALSRLLAEEGITVARRTVAKYRDVLGIEAASQRKARSLAAR
ncbi:MAG TPA: RNA polymerase factor sigma-54 [Paenalcaligenes sp.]|nr:RNA polymerase factor sigma-54 [Paenalcaligenes sp.]